MGQQRQQSPRLAWRCGGHPQVCLRKKRRRGDLGQQAFGEVSVQRDGAGPRGPSRAKPTIGQGAQDLVPGGLQRMGVGDGRDQAVRAFDGHVAVGRQILGPVDRVRHQPQPVTGGDQLVPLGVAANGGQQGRRHPEPPQRHRDVHRHASRQPRDPPRHVRAKPHRRGRAPDDVPQDRTDAKDVRRHGCVLADASEWRKTPSACESRCHSRLRARWGSCLRPGTFRDSAATPCGPA